MHNGVDWEKNRKRTLPAAPLSTFLPHCFQFFFFSERVHAFPEASMLISSYLAVLSQLRKRLSLPHDIIHIAFEIMFYFRLDDKISGVNPGAAVLGLLFKRLDNAIIIHSDNAKSAAGLDRSHGTDFAGSLMKGYNIVDISINESVAVREQEGFILGVRQDPFEPACRHCIQSSVNKRYFKGFCIIIMIGNTIVFEVNRHICVM